MSCGLVRPVGAEANAALLGAKTVNGPLALSAGARPVATLATTTLAGGTVPAQTITINRNLTITDTTTAPATILATDVRASNGVIHVIGKVLIPK